MSLPTTPGGWHARILSLSWPVILANITVPLVGVADVWVMGRMPDPVFIAAVALGATFFSSFYWLFGFLRMGTTGLVAQAFGALQVGGDANEIGAILVRALSVALGLGLLMVLLQVPLLSFLLWIFQPEGTLAALTSDYYSIRIWGAPALLIYLAEMGLLFGLQRMRDTLVLSVGFNLVNVALNMILVLGLDMGVEGVALGTLISEWLAAALGALFVMRALGRHGYTLELSARLFGTEKIRALFNVSGNLIIRTFFVQLPFLVGARLATDLGETTLAVHAVLMQMFFVMAHGLDGFAHASETLAGYAFGARNRNALRQSTIYGCGWASVAAILFALVFLVFGQDLVAAFTVSDAVRAAAEAYLPWLAFTPLVCIWAFLLDGIFIGTTHLTEMRNAMIASAAVWAGILFLSFDPLHYHGVWLAFTAFMLIRGILLAWKYPTIERNADEENRIGEGQAETHT